MKLPTLDLGDDSPALAFSISQDEHDDLVPNLDQAWSSANSKRAPRPGFSLIGQPRMNRFNSDDKRIFGSGVRPRADDSQN